MSGAIEQLETTPKSLDYFDENRRLISAILAVLVGGLGIHKFYLGYTKAGFWQFLLFFVFGISVLIALIEAINYLSKTDEEFYDIYIKNKKAWF